MSVYGGLTAGQQRRFNQMWGLYMNETLIFMETTLPAMLARSALRDPSLRGFHDDIRAAMADERVHASLFAALNRKAAPVWYELGERHFRNDAGPALRLFVWMFGSRFFLPVLLWTIFMSEEKAAHFGRRFRADRDQLDPLFCKVYLDHEADEACHCDCDRRLLDHVWPRLPAWRRKICTVVFRWLTRNYFTAPRQGMRVVDAWLAEFPELRGKREELRREFKLLGRNEGYVRALCGPDAVPMTVAKMAEFPEMGGLRSALLALGGGAGVSL